MVVLVSSSIDRRCLPDQVKLKTIEFVFAASPLCRSKKKEQRMVGSESG